MSEPGVNDSPAANGGQGDGQPPASEPQMTSPGARLAAYRKERGWTIEQVASQLNLAPRQIVAIESDDYPALPGMPIVRGFIRAYAKLLKIDPAPLLATLGGETVLAHEPIAPRKTLSTPFSEKRLPSMVERPGLSSKWIVGLLLIILVGVAIWATQWRGDSGGPSKPMPSETKLEVTPAPNTAEVPAKPTESAAQPAEANAPTGNAAPAPEQAPAATNSVPALNAPANPAPATPSAAEVPAAAGKDTLQFKVREDSWIEIRRKSNNDVVLSRLVKAGETETVDVTEPVSVVIGNASGVEASLRGTPLTLKAGRGNVARLNLK
ncbi:RodZ domain-containing protein [Noviherbaspirillum sp.]|jgi:cytoskeleton protein RodZ|uniref:helix-turn-helix domain-containing protein n=1 Tax=Noviherbaspirillum sp. TaxID=1926288 RepID=UPI0025F6A72F|nr:RodZ domain-containing protein [Noviherbaspirillum sp.]